MNGTKRKARLAPLMSDVRYYVEYPDGSESERFANYGDAQRLARQRGGKVKRAVGSYWYG